MKYKEFIRDHFQIVDKKMQLVSFELNKIQDRYMDQDFTGRDIVLKARQQGFSSLISAIFTTDFILQEHSYSVIVADIDDNAEMLLQKVKSYISSYNLKNKVKVPLKYNSRTELYNPFMDSRFNIGTAKNSDFGRSRTISNLHLSEVAFYPDIQRIIAGAGQAVIEGGKLILETTANGFNEFKTIYDDAKLGLNGYKAHFYKASDYYSPEFLETKRRELGRLFPQEYPESDIECFLASGDCYFDTDALKSHFVAAMDPIEDKRALIYV